MQVNGDSSQDGNIELSIRMPGGQSNQQAGAGSDSTISGNTSREQAVSTQRQQQQTNGYSRQQANSVQPTRRLGTRLADLGNLAAAANISREDKTGPLVAATKLARDLSHLIDLMPPLSIEQNTKRLILAKKLDRENLDRYIQAGGYQSSPLSSLSQSSSSASLTVHIKCQLKDRGAKARAQAQPATSQTEGRVLDANGRPPAADEQPAAGAGRATISRGGSPTNSILIPIHLIVTDENDNWPIFVNSPYIIDLNETSQIGALLQGNEIVAVDGDQQGPLSTIEYSIVPGSFWSDSFAFLNPLDSRSLVVRDNRLLDYEGQSKLTLKVMARDQGEPPNWAITSLYINLFDNDDLNPQFNEDKYFGFVRENRPGEVIDLMPKRMKAFDGDKMINSPIVYSFHLKTNHSIHFDLDPDLGKLSIRKSLPEELASSRQPFCLLVRASQADNSQRWTLTMVNLRLSRSSQLQQLLSLADATSADSSQTFGFANANITVEVSESAPVGFTIMNLRVLNAQSTQSEVTYHLLDDQLGHFNLDEHSGRLTLNKSLDYELYRQLSVRVLATQELPEPQTNSAQKQAGAYPKLVCDTTRVNVNIIGHNDYTPEFSHEQYNFQLPISDLIANFDLPKMQTGDQVAADEQVQEAGRGKEASVEGPTRRFGELELEENQDEAFGWRAMQLGQVYCADRDFGDKVSLQLAGSKQTYSI